MADDPLDNAKLAFDLAIALPGGGLTGLLLFPTGCTTDTVFNKDPLCLEGERTNVFGWTMGGLVGNADSNGAFLFGILVAVVIFGGLLAYQTLEARSSA
jgi:hypothetical protein